LECRVLDIRKYGENRVVVVEILLAHVRAGIADPVTWRVDYAQYAPVGRMNSPDGYVRTRDIFRKDFPRS
jgi:flavin reductase (DIM6/NTAB) family NADH-FMN oxidoreductase RutF